MRIGGGKPPRPISSHKKFQQIARPEVTRPPASAIIGHATRMVTASRHPASLSKAEMLRMSPEKILAYWERREEAIKLEKDDPYRHGFELETWRRADNELKSHQEILVMGGNRAGKSEWAAKRVVQCLVENPGTIIWCLTETSANSIQFRTEANI